MTDQSEDREADTAAEQSENEEREASEKRVSAAPPTEAIILKSSD